MTISSIEISAGSEYALAEHPSLNSASGLAKRLLDLFVAVLGGITLLPVFLIIVVLIKLDTRGPIVFKHRRVGLNGNEFMMYKFRSMHIGSEALQAELQAFNEMQGPMFKMRNDPRITRVGRWLRRTSFDEFPQLINVIRGEMSLVGPRPPLPSEVEQFESWQRGKFAVRPGMTGLWQVSGRNDLTSFSDIIRLDLEYIRTWTFFQDIVLLGQTVNVVLKGLGAR